MKPYMVLKLFRFHLKTISIAIPARPIQLLNDTITM